MSLFRRIKPVSEIGKMALIRYIIDILCNILSDQGVVIIDLFFYIMETFSYFLICLWYSKTA